MNIYTNQIIKQSFLIYMQPKQNMLISRENDNTVEYLGLHKNEKYILDEQDIKEDYRDLVGKSLDLGSCAKNSL